MSDLYTAISIAIGAHRGQKDKAGEPYMLHLLRVMMKMSQEPDRIVALLHDVVEDTHWTITDIHWKFGHEVSSAVDALTKRKGESYDDYLSRVEANDIAIRVKMADLTDNMDMSRLPRATAKDWERFDKYLCAFERLSKTYDAQVLSQMQTEG